MLIPISRYKKGRLTTCDLTQAQAFKSLATFSRLSLMPNLSEENIHSRRIY